MKNRRSLASTLFSPVPMKALRVVNYTTSGLIVLFAIITAALLWQFQNLLTGVPLDGTRGEFALDALSTLRIVIPATLVPIALFVLLSEMAHRRQMQGEMVALLDQIKSLREGQYTRKRSMRKHDQLKLVMKELHGLADELDRSEATATRPPAPSLPTEALS